MKRIAFGLVATLTAAMAGWVATNLPLQAGSGTVNYVSSGTTIYRTTTDASSNNLTNFTLWDYAAGLNGAGVDTNHGVLVDPASAALWGIAATGGAPPANAFYNGIVSNSNLTGWDGSVTQRGNWIIQAVQNGTWNFNQQAGSVVSGAYLDGNNVTMGLRTDAAATNSTGGWGIISLLKGIYANTATPPNQGVTQVTSPWFVQVTNATTLGANTVGNSNPVTVSNSPIGAGSIATAQVSVGSTATTIVAARAGVAGTGRVAVTITNTTTTPIYLGTSGVTTTGGTLLPGIIGASITLNTTAQISGIVSTGSATVTAIETF